jgi:FKBP-type peptidyl-prolyl cis-trans isomerase SlyD
MKTKKGDFIEMDFVGRIKDTNEIFDLTNAETAKKENIFRPKFKYKPWIVCVGQGDVLRGLDRELEDKELGKTYKVELKPEDAFGKRSKELLQLIHTSKLVKNDIHPFPGMQLNVDGMFGMIKSVSGSRTLVDFNNPMAGRDVVYEFKIKKVIEDDAEKIKSFFDFNFEQKIDVEKKDDAFVLKNFKLDNAIKKTVKERLEKLLNKKIEYAL